MTLETRDSLLHHRLKQYMYDFIIQPHNFQVEKW